MYKYILEQAGNINWMALFALVTFFTLFLISSIVIFKRKPEYINKMSSLPLQDSYSSNDEKL